jgi:hypothetical protein
MSTRTLSRKAARKTADPCTPCPVCGGLECLCRPRFYAGQLLNEQDLNRLDRYIVAKNRLHNRYLHGWGVACGLEVSCHPCGNYVLLKPGYALSPCGDDIVVCREETVDVCKLIRDCCTPDEDPCGNPRPRPEGCDDVTQEWILGICYHEAPSREEPVVKSSCGPRCDCGGSSSAGCSCGSGKSAGGCGCGGSGGSCKCGGGTHKGRCGCSTKDTAAAPRSRTPAHCEPALVCEGYTFRMYPAPKRQVDQRPGSTTHLPVRTGSVSAMGAMVERMLECIEHLAASVPPAPANTANMETVRRWCCDARDGLLDAMSEHAITSCNLMEALRDSCPAPAPNQTPAQYLQEVSANLGLIAKGLLKECICSALLPPCSEPQLDGCVPLATITIRRKDCRILHICNLQGRKFLVTFPNLAYWLSFLPFGRLLRQRLAAICCGETRFEKRPVSPGRPLFVGRAAAARRAPASPFTAFAGAFAADRKMPTLDALTFDMLGLADENGHPFLSMDQADDPIAAILGEEVIGPLLGSVIPPGGAAALGSLPQFDAARFAGEVQKRDEELKGLRGQLDELQKTVRTQQMTIEGLASRVNRNEG